MGTKPKPLTITTVEKAEMNDGKQKPVLYFAEDRRGLVLNKENRDVLAERFGRDPRAWAGKKVTLITRRVRGPNGPCPGIRFADPPVNEQLDDEIPEFEPSPRIRRLQHRQQGGRQTSSNQERQNRAVPARGPVFVCDDGQFCSGERLSLRRARPCSVPTTRCYPA